MPSVASCWVPASVSVAPAVVQAAGRRFRQTFTATTSTVHTAGAVLAGGQREEPASIREASATPGRIPRPAPPCGPRGSPSGSARRAGRRAMPPRWCVPGRPSVPRGWRPAWAIIVPAVCRKSCQWKSGRPAASRAGTNGRHHRRLRTCREESSGAAHTSASGPPSTSPTPAAPGATPRRESGAPPRGALLFFVPFTSGRAPW